MKPSRPTVAIHDPGTSYTAIKRANTGQTLAVVSDEHACDAMRRGFDLVERVRKACEPYPYWIWELQSDGAMLVAGDAPR